MKGTGTTDARTRQGQRVLSGQLVGLEEIGHRPERRAPGMGGDGGKTIREKRRIAPEAVDQARNDQRRVFWVDDRQCADQRGNDAAAFDIADQNDWRTDGAGEAEIGQIVMPQIDLGGAARAFDQNQIALRRQFGKRGEHVGQETLTGGEIVACALIEPTRWPRSTTWAPLSASGFNRTGFIAVTGSHPAARACSAWARPISPPSVVTAALFDMFCGLNGATFSPCRR